MSGVRLSIMAAIALAPGLRAEQPAVPAPTELKRAMLEDWQNSDNEIASLRLKWKHEMLGNSNGAPSRNQMRHVVTAACSRVGLSGGEDSEDLNEGLEVTHVNRRKFLENPKYKAELQEGKEPGVWILVKYEEGPRDKFELPPHLRRPWLYCSGVLLPNWVADDCFVITRVERVGDGAAQVLRIHFMHDEARRKALAKTVIVRATGGTIDVDPNHRHRITAYRVSYKSKFSEGTEIGTFEYADDQGGLPVLKSSVVEKPDYKSFDPPGSGNFRETNEYDITYNCKVPEEEFRLSHYGLPEPVGITWKKPTPIYVWLLAGAGGCAVLAVGLHRLVRRFRAPA